MSLDRVCAWRDALRSDVERAPDTGLSPQGLTLVLGDALDALDDASLRAAVLRGAGPGWSDATFVAARTVPTAAIEWLAVLLAHGTAVTLKHPSAHAGLAPWLARHAHNVGLPLDVTAAREAATHASLTIVMGDDETVAAVRAARGDRDTLGFGSRWSVAWWPAGTPPTAAGELARDLAAFDGRGCMTPALVLTDALAAEVAEALCDALEDAESRWPRGHVSAWEHAGLRTRLAVARAGGRVHAGLTWSVAVVPPALASPASLPRSTQVVQVADVAAARAWAAAVGRLSTIGTPDVGPWLGLAPRVCALGTMQRPPLVRAHDGVDHLAALAGPAR